MPGYMVVREGIFLRLVPWKISPGLGFLLKNMFKGEGGILRRGKLGK